MDYLELIKLSKRIKGNPDGFPEIRLAVLGDSSTQQLCQVLKGALYQKGIFLNIYEAEYNTIDQEIFNPASGLYGFQPEYVLLHSSMQEFRHLYETAPAADRRSLAELHFERTQSWWTEIAKRSTARIIQNLLVVPLEKPFGNYTNRLKDSFYSNVVRLNHLIVQSLENFPQVFLNDIEHVAGLIGKKDFIDDKIWLHAKILCNPESLPRVAGGIVQIILAGSGRLTKCMVLDCDNTLWGGTIGDDGLNGILLGGEGIGQAFVRFQHYLKDLQKQGILLAVCSKNDQDTALEVFRKHPNMVLREEDIAIFSVNWNNKADNIRQIAQTLNLGLDSFAFLDDSPFERNLLRSSVPEVFVPELPEDPADYVRFLDGLHLFEIISVANEDAGRLRYYQDDVKRSRAQVQFTSINDYLRSLDMEAVFSRFDPFQLPRIVQLLSRSNQFNLTTRRHNEKTCEAFMRNQEQYDPFFISLKDKFGDNGLIGIVILQYAGDKAAIDTWLMSCRVLQRGVEQFTMNKIVELAARRKCRQLTGAYIPTEKNKMVAQFYGNFGFIKIGEDAHGKSEWILDLSGYVPGEHFIQEKRGAEWPAEPLLKN